MFATLGETGNANVAREGASRAQPAVPGDSRRSYVMNVGFSCTVMAMGVAAFAWGLRTRAGTSTGPLPAHPAEASLFLTLAGLVAVVLGAGYLVLGNTVTNAVLVGRTLAKSPMLAIGVAVVQTPLFFVQVVSDAFMDSGFTIPDGLQLVVAFAHATSAFVLLTGATFFLVLLGIAARTWSWGVGSKVSRKLSTWWLFSASVLAAAPWAYEGFR